MKYAAHILFALALAASGYLVFFAPVPNGDAGQPAPASTQWETQTDAEGEVTIEVTPRDLSIGAAEWKFDIVMNTHSVELDQEMTEVAALFDDQGREYKPIAWEGAPSGGHHREGTLAFEAISPAPKSIQLIIKNVGAPTRALSWDI